MQYRCPACSADLGKGRRSQSLLTRMECDCTRCAARLRLNVHTLEAVVVVADFGAIVLFGALAWFLQSHVFALLALGAVALGAAVLPLLERVWLRDWPRYVALKDAP